MRLVWAIYSVLIYAVLLPASGIAINGTIARAHRSQNDLYSLPDLDPGTGMTIDEIIAEPENTEQYRALYENDKHRQKRKANSRDRFRWTKKTIPYTWSGVSETWKALIKEAITEWETYTCIQFRPAIWSDVNVVQFATYSSGRCESPVGMQGGHQDLELGAECQSKGGIVREIGHAVGFWNEDSRSDRDQYVTILSANVEKFKIIYLGKANTNNYGVPYDYNSIMHRGRKTFSRNGKDTIKTKDPKYQDVIGTRKRLSFYDVMLANKMYNCCDKQINCPQQDSFLGKDCKCWCKSDTEPAKLCDGSPKPTVITPRPICMDKKASCYEYGKKGYCYGVHGDWMTVNCPKTCYRCDDEEKKPPCPDKTPYCKFWLKEGYKCDGKYAEYMTEMCKKTCGKCKVATCADKFANCEYFKKVGYCTGIYEKYMTANCPKSCSLC